MLLPRRFTLTGIVVRKSCQSLVVRCQYVLNVLSDTYWQLLTGNWQLQLTTIPAVYFLWHFPSDCSALPLAGVMPCAARTFLTRLPGRDHHCNRNTYPTIYRCACAVRTSFSVTGVTDSQDCRLRREKRFRILGNLSARVHAQWYGKHA